MRIPPPTAPASRDEGILREWRIIEALDGTDVPHTEAIAVCTDPSVLGRTFYLMGFVDGWSPMYTRRQWPAPFDTDLEARRGLAFQLVEGIALLSKVDWRAKGLGDLGGPTASTSARSTGGRPSSSGSRAASSRASTRPRRGCAPTGRSTTSPGSCTATTSSPTSCSSTAAPARLAAIVDWEMGTVGDPKLDLGWVVQTWPDDTSGDEDAPAATST